MKWMVFAMMGFMGFSNASELKVGESAPLFNVKTHEGKDFDLASHSETVGAMSEVGTSILQSVYASQYI